MNQFTVLVSHALPLVPDQTSVAGGEPTTLSDTLPGVVVVSNENVWREPVSPAHTKFAALPAVELPPLMSV